MRAALLALALTASPIAIRAADIQKGEDIYGERCSMCHVEEGQGQGPNLKGVVGRKAASLPGFAYTPALTASGLTWTPANLNKFLAGPMNLVPGTGMPMIVPDPDERTNLIAFLASRKYCPPYQPDEDEGAAHEPLMDRSHSRLDDRRTGRRRNGAGCRGDDQSAP